MERILAAFDVANLWKACRQEFGPNARIDWQIMCEWMRSRRYPEPVQQRAVAYLVTDPNQKHHALAQTMRHYGYTVRERYMQYHKALKKPFRSDWDIGITIDAMDQIDSYDTFVLASGDGDFSLLLEYLKERGKKVVVLTFESAVSKLLYGVADEMHILKHDNCCFNQA